jgi:hypothetical protein
MVAGSFEPAREAMRFGTAHKPVVVPRSTKSRHTANDALEPAGIPKAF